MPRFKGLACKTRLYSAPDPDDLVADLCPGCGSLLEPVEKLAESTTHQRIAGRFGDFVARREAFLAQAQLDSRRWVDDDGHFRNERLPLARIEATS